MKKRKWTCATCGKKGEGEAPVEDYTEKKKFCSLKCSLARRKK